MRTITDLRLKKLIEILSSAKDYISGSEIANMLGLSKPMVHKLVDNLRKYGFIVEAHSRKGYRLLMVDDLSLANTYVRDVGNRLKFKVHYVENCSSTQDIAETLAEQGVSEGTLVLAERMTKGRGRMGRRWVADVGGLWFTLILKPKFIKGLQLLSLVAGLSVALSVRSFLGIKAKVKWPNDVIYNERKLAGVLVEGKVEADVIKYVLLGIGLNVNNNLPQDLEQSAITLRDLVGYNIPRIPLLRLVLKYTDKYYDLLIKGLYKKVLSDWKKHSSTIGKYVKVYTINGEILEGVAEDISDEGLLILKLMNGSKTSIYAGDVIHLR